jgi:hypothetical protein
MIIAAAGMAASIMAVDPQTTQDRAEGNRLIINGQPLFISGMNIAWNNFARDVGDSPLGNSGITAFVNQFKQIKSAGGNAVRWWLHTDGQADPKFNDQTGAVTGLGTNTINNVRQVLDSAYNYGIVVSLCLFSFDLLNNETNNKTSVQMDRNEKFLTVPANLDSYIQNALRPMLQAVGNHPAIMCWEVFNEPEGMSSDAGGWATRKIAMSHILRFTAKIAAEVHSSTKKMASSGIHEYGKMKTWYSDAKLKQASGNNDAKAYLDFYMAHYYPQYIGTSGSPFHNPASYWQMDRPILIGEFPAQSWGPGTGYSNIQPNTAMTITKAYEYAYDNGYCGALSWSMTEGEKEKFGSFTTTEPALKNLANKHEADIKVDRNVVITLPTGDQVMKVVFDKLPAGDPQAELGKVGDLNLSGKTNLTFDVYIESGSGTNMTILPVVKVGEWVWSPATNYAVDLSTKTAGQWFTVTIPIANGFVPESGSFSASGVKSFLLQFQPSSAYTGTIYINNVKADNTVLYDFDAMGSEWSATKYVKDQNGENGQNVPVEQITVSQVANPKSTNSIFHSGKTAASATNRTPSIVVKGKILNVTGADNSDMRIKMVDMRGKTVANFKSSGSGQFSLTSIPAGRYLVETRIANKRVGSNAIIVK